MHDYWHLHIFTVVMRVPPSAHWFLQIVFFITLVCSYGASKCILWLINNRHSIWERRDAVFGHIGDALAGLWILFFMVFPFLALAAFIKFLFF